jgi:hypothetical protein
MRQSIVHVALVVRDYDKAIEFYTNTLHFLCGLASKVRNRSWIGSVPPAVAGGSTTAVMRDDNG